MIIDLIFAALIALLVSGLFAAFAGRPTLGGEAVGVFLLALLVTWAIGAWVSPFGPALWGGYWVTFLVPGLLFLLLLAALAPPRAPRTRREAVEEARADAATTEAAIVVLGAFFWLLVLALVVAIVGAYV